ncbi:MAG: GldG family protein [Cyclobacteriaceae bacterium]|jgi:gliding-associated putative ABC transporter substrate-binding component GldG|nr:GldG family protein [Cyclobacteriaceae bacterium]
MKSSIHTQTYLIIAIIIVVNLLGSEYYFRLDLTDDKQYTLSRATRDVIANLDEPVTVKAYFSRNLPPDIARTRQDFQDLLVEYASRSDGQILYEFINPNESESKEQEATQSGIHPVLINMREKDQVRQQKAFLGATVYLGDEEEVIPFIRPGAAMEYALTTAIKKLAVSEKPKIGFIQGHGEPGLSEMGQVMEQLRVMYEPVTVNLDDSLGIPDDIKTLALVRPNDTIPQQHLSQLDAFLEKGGRLMVAVNAVEADFRSMYGRALYTGLGPWLREKGVEVMENFVVDARCGSVSVPQQLGFFTIQASVSFPYVPVIATFADHPITSGLEGVMLEFASEIRPTGDSAVVYTPLAMSSDLSSSMPAPQFFDVNRKWVEKDFTRNNIVVAAALESAAEESPFRMVVVGDGDFPVNGPYQQSRQLQPDNVHLFVNAIDWLSDDTGLIALRTRGAVSRPIREMDESTRSLLKYTNFLLPVLLAIGYGVVRSQRNRAVRTKRMNEDYEAV